MHKIIFPAVIACALLTGNAYANESDVGQAALAADAANNSSLFLWDFKSLSAARSAYEHDPVNSTQAIKNVINKADRDLDDPITSVMDSKKTPPSGDRHDYISVSKYWWPDPSKPDGLPYVERDGYPNPQNDIDFPDRQNADALGKAVENLSLAYFITKKDAYGQKAAQMVRAWFIDPATRMNPNLNYAISLPPEYKGHPNGPVEMHFMASLLDSVTLLRMGGAFTAADRAAMAQWSQQYLDWLLTSHLGKTLDETGVQNIAVWYDTEVVALAMFTHRPEIAVAQLEKAKTARIEKQMDPSGLLPGEARRAAGVGYSVFDLQAFFTLAELGNHAGVDLWHYQTAQGASFKKSLDYIIPYLFGQKDWPYQQVHPFGADQAYDLFYQAAYVYKDHSYDQYLDTIDGKSMAGHPAHLYYPDPQH